MKKFYLIIFLLIGFASSAQVPVVLFKGPIASTPNASNDRFLLSAIGLFLQVRFQANVTGSAGWAFHSGSTGAPDYNTNWRPYSSGNTMSMNTLIPTSFANGARYNTGGGGFDGGYNVTTGFYYTWNVSNYNAASQVMQVLETNFAPKLISSVTQSPATPSPCTPVVISVTTSSVLSSGEYVFVRYTTNGYASSTIVPVTFVGNTGTATIPATASPVNYYVYSSNKTMGVITADVVANGEVVHDMSTLNLNNNAGNNYSYTIGPSTGTWSGVAGTDWFNTANWCDGIVPTTTTNVVIPAALTNYPIINSVGALCNHISIVSGATITITNTGSLATAGNFANLGTFTNNGLIKLNGTSAQSFPGSGTMSPLKNIEINNTGAGVTLNNSFSVTGELTPTAGIVALGDNVVTLTSTAANTASVSALGSAAGFTYGTNGGFSIERFLKARSSWRLLATPVEIASSPSISASWREGEAIGTNTPTGYGTRITGPAGMDEYTVRYSMKSYNGNTNSYEEINTPAKLAGPIANKEGYYIFVRGDRGVGVGGLGATTLRIKGKLRTGNQTFTVPPISGSSTGFASFGNPYPSAIDFRTIFNSSISQSYIIWNPDSSGAYGVGKFETYIYNTGTFHFQKTPGNEIRDSIQSGEAVFIQSLTGGSITVKESDKVSGSRLVSRMDLQAQRQGVTKPTLEIDLRTVNTDGSSRVVDGILISFDNAYSNALDNMDVRKVFNSADNLAIEKGTIKLISERRKNLTASDTIFLSLTNIRIAPYRFEIDPSVLGNVPLNAFLKDKFLGTEMAVSLTEVTTVNFDVTNDAGSRVADRFMMVFRPVISSGQLPGNFISVAAQKNADKTNVVKWRYGNEINIAQYSIERSANGMDFTSIGNKNAGNSNSANDYTFTGAQGNVGTVYYRVTATSTTGNVQYSDVVKVIASDENSSFTVQPNPVVNKTLRINFENMLGSYALTLISAQGSGVFRKAIKITGAKEVSVIELGNDLAAGVYELLLEDGMGKKMQQKVIIK